MHTCDSVAEPEVALHAPVDVEALGLVELALVAVRGDQHEHDPLPGAHRLAGDLGVDEQRAADELQRQLVAEHLLERRHGQGGIGDDGGALFGMAPQLVGAAGDDLRQRLGPADEERDQLVDHLGVVERAVAAVEREQAVDDVGRIGATGDRRRVLT